MTVNLVYIYTNVLYIYNGMPMHMPSGTTRGPGAPTAVDRVLVCAPLQCPQLLPSTRPSTPGTAGCHCSAPHKSPFEAPAPGLGLYNDVANACPTTCSALACMHAAARVCNPATVAAASHPGAMASWSARGSPRAAQGRPPQAQCTEWNAQVGRYRPELVLQTHRCRPNTARERLHHMSATYIRSGTCGRPYTVCAHVLPTQPYGQRPETLLFL